MLAASERISKLRQAALQQPEVCVERPYYMTESYKETEGEEMVVRRAKALANILEKMTITIYEGELLVGTGTSKRRGSFILPEVQWEWYLDEMDRMSERAWDACQPIKPEEKEIMKECLPYWKGLCTWDKVRQNWTDTAKKLNGEVFTIHTASMSGQHFGHIVVDYDLVLKRGLGDILREVKADIKNAMPVTFEEIRRYKSLLAYEIVLEGVIRFARRYSEHAAAMALEEKDESRKAELLRISGICARVPEKPAESFYEAVQSVLTVFTAVKIEAYGPGTSVGRPDQYLLEYYRKDIRDGSLTKEFALEIIEAFLIKFNDLACLLSEVTSDSLSGFPTLANITIGGVTKDDEDAVNELTWLIMDAEEAVALTAEEVVIRVNRKNPEEFLLRACDLAVKLRGKIKFTSDYTGIRQLLADGKPIEYARDYVVLGCNTPTVPAKTLDITGGGVNLAYCLELALNNGISRQSGERIGLETGDPKEFKSYEEVWEAYKKQSEYVLLQTTSARNTDRQLYSEYLMTPLHSSLLPVCYETGMDITDVGSKMYASESQGMTGVANVGDSLAAIRKFVFGEKKITMAELIDALDKDFDGYEELQYLLLSGPKFGNDIDYVDSLVQAVLTHSYNVLRSVEGINGTKVTLAAMSGTGNIAMGTKTGALPDGRNAGKPLAEGGISPSQGKNVNGATATMNSVSKLDHTQISGGSVFNMRFNPDAVSTPEKLKKFRDLLLTYCESGGYHVQFNFLSGETLRDAQLHPDLYRDLLVRVSTYSAYFVELSKNVQDDIISKTEFQSC